MLWCSKDKKSKPTFNYKTMKHLNGDKQEKSVWDISICIGSERIKNKDGKKAHSTQKPEELLYKVVLSSSKPNDIILDPFFGTGTTGAIAKKLNRNYIGIEREKEYIDVAKKRINEVEVEISDLYDLKLEVKPPKVDIATLVKENYLKIDEPLYNNHGDQICSISSGSHVSDKKEELSIHKMSAKYLKKENNNGWDYFYIKRNDKLVPINSLRYEYEKNRQKS